MSNGKRDVEGPGVRWERKEFSFYGVVIPPRETFADVGRALDAWLLKNDTKWFANFREKQRLGTLRNAPQRLSEEQ